MYNCEDPYRRPGYLQIVEEDYRQTRWVPYTEDFLNAPEPTYARYPAVENADVYFNQTHVEDQFLEAASTPRHWMLRAVQENYRRREAKADAKKPADFESEKKAGALDWLWGRRVLLLGDSVDRFMLQFFCEEFGYGMQQGVPHTTATCEIPSLNLTIIHWHYAGSWHYRPDWWWMSDMKEIAFEDRWKSLWAPTMDTHVRGPNGQPDLIIWQNGLWDQRALREAGKAHYPGNETLGMTERQLAWQEIRFVGARVKKFVQAVHKEFPNVPTMFRAITVHRNSNATDANIYELDRLSRAIAEQAGHEMFEWGRIVTAFSMLYKDETHTGKGPGSWLWGNMILEYLARSAGAKDPYRAPYFNSWGACHPYLINWGGR